MPSGVVSDLLRLCGPYIFHAELGSHAPPLKCPLDLTWLHLRLYRLLEGGHISQLLPPTSVPGSSSGIPPSAAGSAGEGKNPLSLYGNCCVSAESLYTPDSPFL